MKNRNIIRTFALILTIVMTLSMFVACKDSSDTPAESSKPAETTKPAEEHEHSYGEAVQTKAPTCTEFGEKTATCSCGKTVVSSIAALGHTYENGKCKNCQADEPHTHTFTNNKCSCGISGFTSAANNYGLTGALELASSFDGDKSGANDKFYFSSTLASKFTGTNVITIASGSYDKTASKSPSSNTTGYAGLPHYYITENTDQTLVYKVTVTEAGVYDLAIHLRFKDNKERGNKFTVNPGTDTEYSFETSFKPTTDQVNATKSTDGKDSAYMYGMQIYLNEGENIIKIEASSTEKCQHYRHFYLVKAS